MIPSESKIEYAHSLRPHALTLAANVSRFKDDMGKYMNGEKNLAKLVVTIVMAAVMCNAPKMANMTGCVSSCSTRVALPSSDRTNRMRRKIIINVLEDTYTAFLRVALDVWECQVRFVALVSNV